VDLKDIETASLSGDRYIQHLWQQFKNRMDLLGQFFVRQIPHLLYYSDRSFMVCYMLPNLFTEHIVHNQLLPVTDRKICSFIPNLGPKITLAFSCLGFSALYLGPSWTSIKKLNCHISGNDDSCATV